MTPTPPNFLPGSPLETRVLQSLRGSISLSLMNFDTTQMDRCIQNIVSDLTWNGISLVLSTNGRLALWCWMPSALAGRGKEQSEVLMMELFASENGSPVSRKRLMRISARCMQSVASESSLLNAWKSLPTIWRTLHRLRDSLLLRAHIRSLQRCGASGEIS